MGAVVNTRAVAIRNAKGEKVCMTLDGSIKAPSPFIIKKIEGLGPPEQSLSMSDAPFGGRNYNGQRGVGRRIVITLGFNTAAYPGESIASLKQLLYRVTNSTSETPLTFYLLDNFSVDATQTDILTSYRYDVGLASINGYTTRVDPDEFSREPQMVVTIECEAPYFIDSTATRQTFTGPSFTLENTGSVPVGLYLELIVAGKASKLTVTESSQYPNQVFSIVRNFPGGGERVEIETIPGRRTAELFIGGSYQNLLGNVNNPDWIMLRPGTNIFTISGTTTNGDAATWLAIKTEYYARYLGI